MDCYICLCEIDDHYDFLALPCDHYFHSSCITTWLNKSPECPRCVGEKKGTEE